MDAFFASVEMRDNPQLAHVPMAVGGSPDRRGVLSTANYEARKYGVRSAMATAHAMKLCPQLVLVKPNFRKYSEASSQVFEILHQYTDLIESLSLDEAYLDVSNVTFCQGSATLIAKEIRQKIFEKTALTASAGIGPNKLIAKLASDYKKPNGQFTVAPDRVHEFISQMPVDRIWGVGKVTAKRMNELGIKTCLDLQAYHRSELIHHFGKFGDSLFDYCRGLDEREVETEYERKSLATEETFIKDLNNIEEMRLRVSSMAEEIIQILKEDYADKVIKNLHVKIKYFDFKQTTIERNLPLESDQFVNLFEERWIQDPRPVRLLGVGVKFDDSIQNHDFQLPLFGLEESYE